VLALALALAGTAAWAALRAYCAAVLPPVDRVRERESERARERESESENREKRGEKARYKGFE
jgi:hypothetical protein